MQVASACFLGPVAAILVRFTCSLAKPCMYMIIDDSDNETIVRAESCSAFPVQNALQSGPSSSPDPWQSCRLLEPLPAHGAHRARADPQSFKNEQKRVPSKTITNDNNDHPRTIRPESHQKRSNTIKNSAFSDPWSNRRAIASHRTALPRTITRMTAGQSSSSVAASNTAGMIAH